ncbi:hypothetical protein GGTG_07043 [Gaeumannomyces tritici R3-111a-1]|uniref:Heterokaryon incompatibility domain-containing protein n=1 Tax=Gaeumannomyces tritici (strain R3-111a-1) TaxID=644352 RepID=J3P0J8_GAET3|nr:hypothetical protein GGTG_07043 [Gaeumannomyces tritici R3-111a-1]EJT77131.1 hypothetical protein GGTG_07043 [Gaeumannomyces tritici R3-111a-1]
MYKTLGNFSHRIRLLKLLTGQQTSRLETQLLVVSLNSQLPPYEVLSYVWGQTCDLPGKIMVDGVPLEVTRNLYCALRSLRHNDQPRMLWVDAICINQADISERSRQICLMSRIFSQATHRRCCNVNTICNGVLLSDILFAGFWASLYLNHLSSVLQRQKEGSNLFIPLSHITALFRGRDSTDPRDKIYAFLGLCRGIETDWVDYTLSIEATYEAAARQCILSSKHLDVLSFCHFYQIATPEIRWPNRNAPSVHLSSIPSWLPNWTLRYEPRALEKVAFREAVARDFMGKNWKASGTFCGATISDRDPSGCLGVSSHCFDIIAGIGESQSELHPQLFDALHRWRLLSGVDKDPMSPFAGNGTRIDAFRRTVCMNLWITSGRFIAANSWRAYSYDTWWFGEVCKRNGLWRSGSMSAGTSALVRTYQDMLQACMFGRTFFISEKGYFGLAPSTARVGDRVCLLAGGRVPYILRDSREVLLPDSGKVRGFSLVGDSYVHGIMGGEGMADVEEGRASLERWALV